MTRAINRTQARQSARRIEDIRSNILPWNSSRDALVAAKPRNGRRVYTLGEIARALGVRRQTVLQWVNAGKLRATRRGPNYVTRRDKLRHFIEWWSKTTRGANKIAKMAQLATLTEEPREDANRDDTASSPSPLPPSETLRHVNVQRYSTYMTPWHRVTLEQYAARLGSPVSPLVRDWVELYGTNIDDGY